MEREITTPFGRTIYPSRMPRVQSDRPERKPGVHYHSRGPNNAGRCVACGAPLLEEGAGHDER